MSRARIEYLRRHAAHQYAWGQDALNSVDLAATEATEAARSLRSGLMVQMYASLEVFLRDRVDEAMAHIAQGPLAFSSLPQGLQDAATFGAIRGLHFRITQWGIRDPRSLPLVQTHSAAVGSTKTVPYSLSGLAFGNEHSNVAPARIKEFLMAAGVPNDPWYHMTQVASRVGIGSLALEDGISGAFASRNASAHDASSQISMQDLSDFLSASLSVAIGFDLLLSSVAARLHLGTRSSNFRVIESDVQLRFADQKADEKWRERSEHAKRASAVHRGSLDRVGLLARARRKGEYVVIRDARQRPVDWETPDCP